MTTYDANGVARYEPADLVGDVDDLLNLGMESVSQAVDLLRIEVTEAAAVIGTTPSSPWTTSTSYPIPALVELNGLCLLTSGLYIRPSALTVAAGASHTMAATATGGVPHPLLPAQEAYGTGVVFANSAVPVPCYIAISNTGSISFQPYASVTFGTAGGPTNSVRITTLSWLKP